MPELTMISGADGVSFSVRNVLFGMPVALTFAPEPLQGLEHKIGDVGIQAWISIDYGRISAPHCESCRRTLGAQFVFLPCVFTSNVF